MSAAAIQILVALAAGISVVLLATTIFYPLIARRSNFKQRFDLVAGGEPHISSVQPKKNDDSRRRRLAVEKTLREMEERQRQKSRQKNNPSLAIRMRQAKLDWTVQTFILISVLVGVATFALLSILRSPVPGSLFLATVAAVILPRFYVNRRRRKVFQRFTAEFPTAVDVIVRGIRTGLPLGDCLEVIATEASEPVRSEFVKLVDDQKLGIPVTDAIHRLADRMPVTETNFFATVITMQSQTGGNLSEVLYNLSQVMREQAKMKSKVKALSSEAKTSAIIIGSMPIIVALMVYLISPDYMSILFTTSVGIVVVSFSAIWMVLGIIVMRQMMNFDF